MSRETRQDHITKTRVVYEMPGTDAVVVRTGVEFLGADAGTLTMDLYYPPGSNSNQALPAIVIVLGYPDTGTRLGCKFKEMAWTISWGRLMAASGMVAIAYTNRNPESDLHALFDHLRRHSAALGIDESRIGIWAASGSVPMALSMLMHDARVVVKCAALWYGFMLDLDGDSSVRGAASQWGFVNPAAGKTLDDLALGIPLFIARAGQDQFAHLNETLDRFLARALTRNLPISFVNHADAPHAFDLFHDSDTSREIIKCALAFMSSNLVLTSAL